MMSSASAYVEMVNETIAAFISDRAAVVLDVDNPKSALAEVWERCHIEGDFDAAIMEYRVRHNAS